MHTSFFITSLEYLEYYSSVWEEGTRKAANCTSQYISFIYPKDDANVT